LPPTCPRVQASGAVHPPRAETARAPVPVSIAPCSRTVPGHRHRNQAPSRACVANQQRLCLGAVDAGLAANRPPPLLCSSAAPTMSTAPSRLLPAWKGLEGVGRSFPHRLIGGAVGKRAGVTGSDGRQRQVGVRTTSRRWPIAGAFRSVSRSSSPGRADRRPLMLARVTACGQGRLTGPQPAGPQRKDRSHAHQPTTHRRRAPAALRTGPQAPARGSPAAAHLRGLATMGARPRPPSDSHGCP
jgi:hypothetical protein